MCSWDVGRPQKNDKNVGHKKVACDPNDPKQTGNPKRSAKPMRELLTCSWRARPSSAARRSATCASSARMAAAWRAASARAAAAAPAAAADAAACQRRGALTGLPAVRAQARRRRPAASHALQQARKRWALLTPYTWQALGVTRRHGPRLYMRSWSQARCCLSCGGAEGYPVPL